MITLALPSTVNKFFEWRNNSLKEFKTKWDFLDEDSIYRTEKLSLNKHFLKFPEEIQNFFPNLILKNYKEEWKKNKKTFIGEFFLREKKKYFLIKIVFFHSVKVLIKIANLEQNAGDELNRFILYNFYFFFCNINE